jgi:hypothetical protein
MNNLRFLKDKENCNIFGPFSYMVQIILCVMAFMILVCMS